MPVKPRFEPARARFIVDAGGALLYRSRSGRFFTVTQLADGSGLIKEVTEEEARKLTKEHADPSKYALFFDTEPPVKISFDIPATLLKKIDAKRNERLKTRRSVILSALAEYTKE